MLLLTIILQTIEYPNTVIGSDDIVEEQKAKFVAAKVVAKI